MVDIDDYNEVKECTYKDEHYSARDNGAVMRHSRKGKCKRKIDNVWTFGKPNDKTGYMELAGQRVHRIVAFAFLGNPPSDQYVVDHVDTNRRNNRPENLRWVTRLENVLNNPITRARIENLCGIEAFLADPSVLRGHEKIDPNFSWMRAVSQEEARVSYENLLKWSKEPPKPKGGSLGEWLFQEQRDMSASKMGNIEPSLLKPMEDDSDETEEIDPVKTQALTQNAIQIDWKHPMEFLCCPSQFTDNPLGTYMANLAAGKVFCKNHFGESSIIKFGMKDSESLFVLCSVSIGWYTHAITKITYKDGIFYHENMGALDLGDDPEDVFDSILKEE